MSEPVHGWSRPYSASLSLSLGHAKFMLRNQTPSGPEMGPIQNIFEIQAQGQPESNWARDPDRGLELETAGLAQGFDKS